MGPASTSPTPAALRGLELGSHHLQAPRAATQILECFGLEEEHPGIRSLRLEIAPLRSLRTYMRQTANNPLPVLRRLRMALDVAIGQGYLHSRGVMACDLSSTNLFVFDDLKVKLGDFGGALLEGADFEWD